MKHRLVTLIALLFSVSVLALCAGCSKPADPAGDPPRDAPAAADPAPSEPSEPAPAAGRNAALAAAADGNGQARAWLISLETMGVRKVGYAGKS